MPRGRSRHGDATRPPVASVVNIEDYRRHPLFIIPPDEGTEEYQPISIDDGSLAAVGILRGDLLVGTLTRRPKQGQLSYVTLKSGVLRIGYYYETFSGARIVSVRPDSWAAEFRRERIEEAAPITWLCFSCAGRTLQIPFERERRGAGR